MILKEVSLPDKTSSTGGRDFVVEQNEGFQVRGELEVKKVEMGGEQFHSC